MKSSLPHAIPEQQLRAVERSVAGPKAALAMLKRRGQSIDNKEVSGRGAEI